MKKNKKNNSQNFGKFPKIKRTLLLSLAAITAGASIFSAALGPVYASGPVKKEEAIFMTLDDQSKIEDSIVSVWLHSDKGFEDFKDPTNLENIINLNEDKKVDYKEGKLNWNSNDKDIYYQGEGRKYLPVDISLKYYLDGKEISKKDLEGKSGDLRITIDFTNMDYVDKVIRGEKTRLYTPYYISSVLSFEAEEVNNVSVNTGKYVSSKFNANSQDKVETAKVINDGDKVAVLAATFPGLYESIGQELDDLGLDVKDILTEDLEITAKVKDFHPSSPMFAMSQNLPFDEKTKEMDSIDDLEDGVNELKDKGEEILDGAKELYDGNEELSDSVDDLIDGVEELNDGAAEAKDGSEELREKMIDIIDGVNELKDGTSELKDGTGELRDGTGKLRKGTGELLQGAQKLDKGTGELNEGAHKLQKGSGKFYEGMKKGNKGTHEVDGGIQKIGDATEGIPEKIIKYRGEVQKYEQSVQELIEKVNAYLLAMKSQQEKLTAADKKLKLAKMDMDQKNQAVNKDLGELEKAASNINSLATKDQPSKLPSSASETGNSHSSKEIHAAMAALREAEEAIQKAQKQGRKVTTTTNEDSSPKNPQPEVPNPQPEDPKIEEDLNEGMDGAEGEEILPEKPAEPLDQPTETKSEEKASEEADNKDTETPSLEPKKDPEEIKNLEKAKPTKEGGQHLYSANTKITYEEIDLSSALNAVRKAENQLSQLSAKSLDDANTKHDSQKKLADQKLPLGAGQEELNKIIDELQEDYKAYVVAVTKYTVGQNSLKDQLLGSIEGDGSEENPGIPKSLNTLKAYLLKTSEKLKKIDQQLQMELSVLQGGAEQLKKLRDGSAALVVGQDKLLSSYGQIDTGINKLATGSDELKSGTGKLVNGAVELDNGALKLDEGARKLDEGASELDSGVAELQDGVYRFHDEGIVELDNGLGDLYDGTQELYDNMPDLRDGVDELTDGSFDLQDGVSRYMDEGIYELSDKVFDKTGSFRKLKDMKDVMQKLSEDRSSFTGTNEHINSKNYYLIKFE